MYWKENWILRKIDQKFLACLPPETPLRGDYKIIKNSSLFKVYHMTIGSENVHHLMVPEVIIEVGPHPAWPPRPSQTYLFFYDLSKSFQGPFSAQNWIPFWHINEHGATLHRTSGSFFWLLQRYTILTLLWLWVISSAQNLKLSQ